MELVSGGWLGTRVLGWWELIGILAGCWCCVRA